MTTTWNMFSSQNGYTYVKAEGKWTLLHRYLMEEKLGRPLGRDERVYFIDGDRTNVQIDNLELRKVKDKSILRKLEDARKLRDELDTAITTLEAQLESQERE